MSLKGYFKKKWPGLYHLDLKIEYRLQGRQGRCGETSKAKSRRIREGFFNNYCRGRGLDVGFGGDLLAENCRGYDFEHGNAQRLSNIRDEQFDFVYSSHTLEHMDNPAVALKNWWRVLKKGGYLILYIPHRDLYEKKTMLPSRWSNDHKHFFLIDKSEGPDTIGVKQLVASTLASFEIVYIKECCEGHTVTAPDLPSDGEYSIEAVINKTSGKDHRFC
jgi:SAM-dependent methyltransferase